jgi:transcriptional regulator with XRE-family HTH domain
MIKRKLCLKRIEKNFTQDEIAYLLDISQSQYSRRERGTTKITAGEWNNLAKILECDLAMIYENDENIELIYEANNNSNLVNVEKNNAEFTFTIMKKYIEKLEYENQSLKAKKL